jgi:hypothetical protein
MSSACQKADWSGHKKMCHKDNPFIVENLSGVIADWIKENLQDIVRETRKVAKSLGISRHDVVVEVDLKSSSCPALLIKPIKDYLEGSAMPDWGCQINREQFIKAMKDIHSRMTDHHIFVLHRSYDGDYGFCRFGFQ